MIYVRAQGKRVKHLDMVAYGSDEINPSYSHKQSKRKVIDDD